MAAVGDRWPRFASRASVLGVGSMLCFQLFTHHDTLGALNLFSDRPHAFGADDRELGLIFASHAAVALAGARADAHWAEAVHSRQRIGEATGILSERYAITTSAAFTMLARASQEHNIKVRELAYRLVATENHNRGGREARGEGAVEDGNAG
jgi:GAF domain-containing protein